MLTLVGIKTKLVNLNMESCLSPGLLIVLAENDFEIIPINIGRCWAVNPALKFFKIPRLSSVFLIVLTQPELESYPFYVSLIRDEHQTYKLK